MSGAWTSHTSGKAIGGSYANLNDKGKAQINFKSTGIAWIGRRNAFGGIAAVYLDGKKAKTVDLYSATTKYEQVIYKITGLKNTTHTLKIVRTGTKNAKSNGGNLIVDAFNVLDTVAPPAPAGVTAIAERSGARITWKVSPGTDIAGYQVFRNARQHPHFDRHHHRRPDEPFRHRPGHRHQLPLHRHCERHQHQHLHPVGQRHRAEREAAAAETRRYASLPHPDHHRDQPGLACSTALAAAKTWHRHRLFSPVPLYRPLPIKKGCPTAPPIKPTPGLRPPHRSSSTPCYYTCSGGIRIDTSSHVIIAGLHRPPVPKGIAVINSDQIVTADTRRRPHRRRSHHTFSTAPTDRAQPSSATPLNTPA